MGSFTSRRNNYLPLQLHAFFVKNMTKENEFMAE
jgi:hypothetical protein